MDILMGWTHPPSKTASKGPEWSYHQPFAQEGGWIMSNITVLGRCGHSIDQDREGAVF